MDTSGANSFDELSSSEGIVVPEEVEAAWREEIARRIKSLEDGTAVLHEWDEVNDEISSILPRRLKRL